MKIKKINLTKKEKGFLDDFLPLFVFILLIAVSLLLFVETNAAINKKADINSIARQYMLKMETQGCLKDSDITDLVTDLNKAGFTDSDGSKIQVNKFKSGCNYTGKNNGLSAGYGNLVELSFTVYTEQWIINPENTDIWKIFFEKIYSPISIEYHSTSKE